ncbi:MAG: leucine--tRNA ligase, partial [Acidobacteriota bacterium]
MSVLVTDYDQDSTERKWQRIWEQERCFEVEQQPSRPKFYCLEMLPYPSGRIHMGHVRNYAIGDAVARFRMMRGYAVLHPMGWDSFGLPAENAAIQRKRHPRDWTEANIADMRGQLKRMGFAYAWSREIASHRPEYYRWNQWLFIRMFERGLAYRSRRPVNWCPSCRTVLANEQVEEDKCWRCGSGVVQKELPQWFFRTSRYADELLEDLDRLDGWPARVLAMQRNWIGRSDGAMIDFPLEDASERLKVFTTRLDTIHGATFLALSPDHPQMKTILKGSPRAETVEKYLEESRRLLVSEKLNPDRGKNGVFTGKFAVNPFTQEKIPIWVADFVLMGYGTGAIMGVPAHDERDHEFATRYRLPIRRVIVASDGGPPPLPFTDPDGRTIDSGEFSGLACDEARRMMLAHAERSGFGEASVQYRLRDWGISRQRYWGTPIPMLYCDGCGIVPVDLSDLPVVLPDDVDLTGRGGSPLQNSAEFTQASCPRCGGLA